VSTGRIAGLKIGTAPAGFLYGLVNNAANTSIDLSVETAGPTKTWTGTANGTWDTTTANWSPSPYTNGSQAAFNNSGINRIITGPAVSPQAIAVTNSAGINYSISNAIGG